MSCRDRAVSTIPGTHSRPWRANMEDRARSGSRPLHRPPPPSASLVRRLRVGGVGVVALLTWAVAAPGFVPADALAAGGGPAEVAAGGLGAGRAGGAQRGRPPPGGGGGRRGGGGRGGRRWAPPAAGGLAGGTGGARRGRARPGRGPAGG